MNYARQTKDPTRQGIGFIVVVLLHVGLIYALINGLGHAVVEVIKSPLETKLIEEVKPPDTPPPPPPPKVAPPPPPFIPLPDIQVRAAPSANAITAVTNTAPKEAPPPPPPPAPKAEPVRVAAKIDAAKNCRPPEYPAVSRRMEEQGRVVLDMLVDLDGRVTDSKVAQSSGHPRLDEAAREALSLCKFQPATVDGKPERTWSQISYVWKLQ
jgi:protein TonB